jgi:cyclic pyranopterin phosphate synthase
VKVNVVSLRGYNDDEVFDFVDFADAYNVNLRFIEYMPFSGNGWQRGNFLPTSELKARLEQHYVLLPLNGDPAAAARNYRIEGLRGSIGFISPVSTPFCSVCNRLRLTADGHLRPCLHGSTEIDIKGPLRQGAGEDDLAALFHEAVARKPRSHHNFSGHSAHPAEKGRAMVKIGG